MKLIVLLTALAATSAANPLPVLAARDVDPALVPQFGITPGTSPDQNGTCLGYNGARIPCNCPPDRNTFISKLNSFVNAGNANGTPITWATGSSCQDKKTRLTAAITTLQNLNGQGKGCPVASTTFQQQRQQLGC